MAINFPAGTPANNATFTWGGYTYTFDGGIGVWSSTATFNGTGALRVRRNADATDTDNAVNGTVSGQGAWITAGTNIHIILPGGSFSVPQDAGIPDLGGMNAPSLPGPIYTTEDGSSASPGTSTPAWTGSLGPNDFTDPDTTFTTTGNRPLRLSFQSAPTTNQIVSIDYFARLIDGTNTVTTNVVRLTRVGDGSIYSAGTVYDFTVERITSQETIANGN